MSRVRRRTLLIATSLLIAVGVAVFVAPARHSGRGAVPAGDGDARRVLSDLTAWDAATHDERRAAAAWAASRAPGFDFDGTETFGLDGHRHEIAVFTHAATGLEFSLVPGGTFSMGSPIDEAERLTNEAPQAVAIGRAFLLCRTETTQAAWERVMPSNRSFTPGADHPVEGLTWRDAASFCAKAGLRLPSEAEWEYACRAGTTTRFWSGDDEADLVRVDWVKSEPTAWARTVDRVRRWWGGRAVVPSHHPVAAKSANPFGLHDVHGNVWEWCQDASTWFPAPSDGLPRVEPRATGCVVRGGGWNDVAPGARSARRFGLPRGSRYGILGFRPAASVGQ